MGKASLGLIVGVVVTGLAFFLLNEAPQEVLTSFTANEAPGTDSTPPEASPDETNQAARSDLPETAEAAASTDGVTPTVEAERGASEPAPAIPIVLPREFDWLSSEPGFQRFEREDIDPTWSAPMEAQINRYFAERPDITSKYGFPTVHCRTKQCQIYFAVYGIDESTLVPELGRSLAADYADQPWAEQFGLVIVTTNNQDGVTTLIWGLGRKEER